MKYHVRLSDNTEYDTDETKKSEKNAFIAESKLAKDKGREIVIFKPIIKG
jgi:hypothetical protein